MLLIAEPLVVSFLILFLCVCHDVCAEVRRQHVGSQLSPSIMWVPTLELWQQAALPAEPSRWPHFVPFYDGGCSLLF